MATSLNTPNGIMSFPQLFQPRSRSEGGEAVFSASLIFAPEQQRTPAYKALQDACIAVARAKFGEKVALRDLLLPFRDAGEKAGKYVGYVEGHTYINPWSKMRPNIVDANRQDVLLPEQVWAGQLARFNVSPFAWLNSGKKGVSFGLNHVQIVRTDGPRIDGRAAASSAFDDGLVKEDDMFA